MKLGISMGEPEWKLLFSKDILYSPQKLTNNEKQKQITEKINLALLLILLKQIKHSYTICFYFQIVTLELQNTFYPL